jgi:ribosomal protein S12
MLHANLSTSRNQTVSYTDSKYKDYIIREYSSDTPGLRFRVIYGATEESLLLETRKQAEQLIIDRLERMKTGGKAF